MSIKNILETFPIASKYLCTQWKQADSPEDWAKVYGIIGMLHMLECDPESEEALLDLYSIALRFQREVQQ